MTANVATRQAFPRMLLQLPDDGLGRANSRPSVLHTRIAAIQRRERCFISRF